MQLVKTLIAGTAIMLAIPTFAAASDWHENSYQPTSGGGCDWNCQSQGEFVIINGQLNLGNVWSKVNADVQNAVGDVNINAASVGNTAEIVTMDDTYVDNTQVNKGDVGATVNANVDSVAGYVNIGAAAACNSVDVSTDPNETAVSSVQFCGKADPEAIVNANISNTGGVGIAAQAVGNQFTADFERHPHADQHVPAERGRRDGERERGDQQRGCGRPFGHGRRQYRADRPLQHGLLRELPGGPDDPFYAGGSRGEKGGRQRPPFFIILLPWGRSSRAPAHDGELVAVGIPEQAKRMLLAHPRAYICVLGR